MRKDDADEIVSILDSLHTAEWVGAHCRDWLDYLFHVTDVRNAVAILRLETLLGRSQAMSRGIMANDNASPSVIGQTADSVRDYARMYFRPRTPTFFHNEGFRPEKRRSLGAHCPMPVAFLFDARAVLCRTGTEFSRGSLARQGTELGSSADFLRSIPFEDVYHDAPRSGKRGEAIKFHRHAEVLVPGSLPLEPFLRSVIVRSPAELATLRTLYEEAGEPLPSRYARFIKVSTTSRVFYRQWSFVEQVVLNDNILKIAFNPSTETPGPFEARWTLEPGSGRPLVKTMQDFSAWLPYRFKLKPEVLTERFRLTLELDGCLAFRGILDPTTGPVVVAPQRE